MVFFWCSGTTERHIIIEILLKITLNTIPITHLKIWYNPIIHVNYTGQRTWTHYPDINRFCLFYNQQTVFSVSDTTLVITLLVSDNVLRYITCSITTTWLIILKHAKTNSSINQIQVAINIEMPITYWGYIIQLLVMLIREFLIIFC